MEDMMSHHKPFPYLLGDLIGKTDWRRWRLELRLQECVLGQGGQGNVYSAVHIYTNLPVAVKVVDKRKVKTWDLLMGRSVPREFKLLYQLQGQFTPVAIEMTKCSQSVRRGGSHQIPRLLHR